MGLHLFSQFPLLFTSFLNFPYLSLFSPYFPLFSCISLFQYLPCSNIFLCILFFYTFPLFPFFHFCLLPDFPQNLFLNPFLLIFPLYPCFYIFSTFHYISS